MSGLREAIKDYIFPEITPKLVEQLSANEKDYISINSPPELAKRLTADMRAIGNDKHLQVTFNEQLAIKKVGTPAEEQRAHEFDRANGLAYAARDVFRET